MIACDEQALICDLAEVYHIYNYREWPVSLIATLSVGLRADSRILMKLNKEIVSIDTILLTSVVDQLNIMIWQNTKDGREGRNKPKLLMPTIMASTTKNTEGYYTVDDFEAERKRLLNKLEGGDQM